MAYDRTRPPEGFLEVTPDDDNDLPGGPCRGLLIGTGGIINCDGASSGSGELPFTNAGEYAIALKRIRATNTTATDIWALY